MFGLGSSKGIIGLDIGSSSIKVAEVKDTKKGYHLENLGIQSLPPEVIVDGAIMNASAVADAIQTLLGERKIKTKNVCTSLGGTGVIVKRIKVPAKDPAELATSIQFDAAQYIPFDINDVNLSHQIIGGPDEEGQMEVLMVAARKDLVNDYVTVIKEAGLNPVIMDIDGFAVYNMFEVNYPIQPDEVVALVNVGATVINIVVTKGGTAMFTRDVSAGGHHYTEEIQKQLGVSYEEAEMLKIGGASGADTEEVMRQEVQDIIRTVSENIAMEVQKSLDFFSTTSPEDHISKIWISGGASKVSGFKEVLEERSGIPVELVNPFNNISFDEKKFDINFLEQIGPQAAVAVGLALRRMVEK